MSGNLLVAMAVSLAMTLVLEVGFYLLICKRNKSDLLLVITVNVMTNPAVVLLYWLAALHTGFNLIFVKAALEILAVLSEWYYYRRYAREIDRPFMFSLAVNAFSFGIGVLIQKFI